MQNISRQKVWELLCRYTETGSLRKHALAVEAAMRYYAEKFGEDVEYWGAIGLLHDFDYEKYPDKHPLAGPDILRAEGFDEAFINSILSHVDFTGVPRETKLEKTLYAVDELCGFIIAVALVRPSRKLEDVRVKSVKKKMKDKAFARQVSREEIIKGAEELGIPLDEHIGNVIEALQKVADHLGL
ncbi:MAG: HAD family hydrolase [candidate division Zixibacteria bacterium 4484_95]|nr:MAG: HAD family hydrolase [candidate division Zixibacteria bacterium 4484_95]